MMLNKALHQSTHADTKHKTAKHTQHTYCHPYSVPTSSPHLHGFQLSTDFLQFPVHCHVLGHKLCSPLFELYLLTNLLLVLELIRGEGVERGELKVRRNQQK